MRYTNARNIRMTDPSVTFRIDRSVTAPELETRGRCLVYPFDRMRVGDSFMISDALTRWRVVRAALNYSKRHQGYAFKVKRVGNGRWRCWRV